MQKPRGRLLSVFAVLFLVLAVSNLAKPLAADPHTGFVFFGRRLSGTPNAIIGPLFGLFLLVYAVGILRMRRWALAMGALYAAYVVVNLVLFTVRDPEPARLGVAFNAIYGIVAIGVSAGAAWVLARRRAELT
jgi:hypothetical protein